MSLSPELSTFLTAMTPLGELRLALPVALLAYKMNIAAAFLSSVAGNMLPVFLLLLFWKYLSQICRQKIKACDKFLSWLFERTRRKFAGKYSRWGKLALVLFVALPLPVTGAWTGSVAAWLFGFKYWESIALIFSGVLIAGLIVCGLTLAGIYIF